MENFNKITIEEVHKEDMLMILEALDYTGQNTNMDAFISLKNSILEQLCTLAQTTEEEFLNFLKK